MTAYEALYNLAEASGGIPVVVLPTGGPRGHRIQAGQLALDGWRRLVVFDEHNEPWQRIPPGVRESGALEDYVRRHAPGSAILPHTPYIYPWFMHEDYDPQREAARVLDAVARTAPALLDRFPALREQIANTLLLEELR